MSLKQLEQKQQKNILELNSILLDNNLDTSIVYELINNFYNYGFEKLQQGKQDIKEIYNL